MRIVPQESNWLPGHLLDGPISIVIAVGSGKDDDAKFHRFSFAGRDQLKG
jgi:hypothetical protein